MKRAGSSEVGSMTTGRGEVQALLFGASAWMKFEQGGRHRVRKTTYARIQRDSSNAGVNEIDYETSLSFT